MKVTINISTLEWDPIPVTVEARISLGPLHDAIHQEVAASGRPHLQSESLILFLVTPTGDLSPLGGNSDTQVFLSGGETFAIAANIFDPALTGG